jgi:hypothetical protein
VQNPIPKKAIPIASILARWRRSQLAETVASDHVTAASIATSENIGEPWLRTDGNIFVVGKDQQNPRGNLCEGSKVVRCDAL